MQENIPVKTRTEPAGMQEASPDPSVPAKGKKKKKKKSRWAFLKRFVIKIAVIAAIAWAVLTYAIGIHRMTGNSMFPHVKDGDLCITYLPGGCHSRDVILYRDPAGSWRIGRIVAIPGEEVNFPEEGGYTVNNFQPTEDIPYQTFAEVSSKVGYPLKVQPGTFFVMNDFRSDTADSRSFGPVSEEDIHGRLIFVLRRRSF